MRNMSLGLIETLGWTAAVEAADAGTKAANVALLPYGRAGAGLITIQFRGEVAAVKAAVTAAAAAARRIGKVVSVHVIPRPDPQLELTLPGRPLTGRPGPESKPASPPVEKPSEEKAVGIDEAAAEAPAEMKPAEVKKKPPKAKKSEEARETTKAKKRKTGKKS
ncbi:MAG: BMC domain-containing protein [Deltaproteobacteria bacterium]|nr:BMC domain-containing protein [Deltaproteobacteria bacterium]